MSQTGLSSARIATNGLALFTRLRLPWRYRRSVHHTTHEAFARENAVAVGLLSPVAEHRDRLRFDAFIAADSYSYPYADLNGLNLAGLFNQWLYFIDDQYDDHPEFGRDVEAVGRLMRRSLDILAGGELPAGDKPFDRFTARMRAELFAHSDQAWQARFLAHVEEYLLEGSLAAMKVWSSGQLPPLDEYCRLRLFDSALFAVFDVVELANVLLSAEVRHHPLLRTLRYHAARHVAFANDLFSYQKEVVQQGMPFNLLHVLQANESLTIEQAVDRAVRIVNCDMEAFLAAERQLTTWGSIEVDTAVERYLDGLKAWMRGNIDFSLSSPRFRAPDSMFTELRPRR
jgi:hypothetical protein